MGLIHRLANDEAGAQRCFATAHKLDPEHKEVQREVRLTSMRKEKADDEKGGLFGRFTKK